ncbi:polyketide cyclase [Mycobacterium sp. 1164985.4]|nr:SRPBCC family protein [Mycobacterium sp. 1164985.4]OBK76621.1 polyketide cyclase [Mycobacterium sp. 1164985.4]
MVRMHEQRTIAASPERVFEWLLDPTNLTVSPWFRKAAWVDASGPGLGATREVRGFGWWVHEQITAYDPPHSCSYRVVGGVPPTHQNGTLTCTPAGGGTHVDWISGYTIPARGGGKVLEVLTAPLMRSLVFRKILASCAEALEA